MIPCLTIIIVKFTMKSTFNILRFTNNIIDEYFIDHKSGMLFVNHIIFKGIYDFLADFMSHFFISIIVYSNTLILMMSITHL